MRFPPVVATLGRMLMDDDVTLLRRYAEEGDEAAFRALVERRCGLVYAVAARQVGGDEHLARDVAQVVFRDLARQAAALARREVLTGWLYRAARFTAIEVLRAEKRRRAREEAARLMAESSEREIAAADWQRMRPLLDEVLSELGERDRDAIVLRAVEERSFAEIGRALRLTENAARMCYERALEKVRARLRRRGVVSTTAALGLALADHAVAAVPAGLPALVAGEALAGAKVAAGLGATAGAIGFMSTPKMVGTLAAAALLAVGFGGFAERAARRIEKENTERAREVAALRPRTAEKAAAAERPAGVSLPAAPGGGMVVAGSGAKTGATAAAVTAEEIAQLNSTYESIGRLRRENVAYQQLMERQTRAAARIDNAEFYRARGLTREQSEALEGLVAKYTLASVDLDGAVRAQGLAWTDLVVAAMRERNEQAARAEFEALLGAGGYEALQRYDALDLVRGVVRKVAGDSSFTETPLTTAQGARLAEIIARHNPMLANPDDGIEEARIDWQAVVAEAKPVLAPEQLDALRGAAAFHRWRGEYIRALNAARNP